MTGRYIIELESLPKESWLICGNPYSLFRASIQCVLNGKVVHLRLESLRPYIFDLIFYKENGHFDYCIEDVDSESLKNTFFELMKEHLDLK